MEIILMPKMYNGRVVPETGNIIFVNNPDNSTSSDGGITPYESNPVQYLIDVYGENSGTGAGVYIETIKNDNIRILKFKNILVDDSLYLYDNGNTLSIGISPSSGLPVGNNVLAVNKGGTGSSSLPFNCLLVGNGVNPVQAIPLPASDNQFLTFENNNYIWKEVNSSGSDGIDIISESDIITISISNNNKTFTLNVDQTKINIEEINGILGTNKGGTGLTFVGANNQVLVSNGTSLEYKTITAGMISDLAIVATTGDYDDLINKPVLTNGTVTSVGVSSSDESLIVLGGDITTSGIIDITVDPSKLSLDSISGILPVSKGGTGVSSIGKDNIVIGVDNNTVGVILPPEDSNSFLTHDSTGYVWKTINEVIPGVGKIYEATSTDDAIVVETTATAGNTTFSFSFDSSKVAINDLSGVLGISKGGTGLSAVGADGQFLISRNGIFAYSFIEADMVSGLSTVATTGDYNDLRNKPASGSVSSVGLISSNPALVVSNSPITSSGDIGINLNVSLLRLQDMGGLLTVPKGGTGRNTIPKDSILIGNDTQSVGLIDAPDTNNNFLSYQNGAYIWKTIEPSKYTETLVTSGSSSIAITSNTETDPVSSETSITYEVAFDPSVVPINSFSGILSPVKGGTGLSTIGANGTILQSNGLSLVYSKVNTTSIDGLSDVATSGDYNDLINKPTVGTGTVTSVGITSLSDSLTVQNTPITSSGSIELSFDPSKVSINDLSGILSVENGGTGLSVIGASGTFISSNGSELSFSNITTDNIDGLSDVATTGDYNDLINKPVLTNGTVTSVGLTSSHVALSISNSPITSTGNINIDLSLSDISLDELSGVLSVSKGGTGVSSISKNSIIIGDTDSSVSLVTPLADTRQKLIHDVDNTVKWVSDSPESASVERVIFDDIQDLQNSPNIGDGFLSNSSGELFVYRKNGDLAYDVLTSVFSNKLLSSDGQTMVGLQNTLGDKDLILSDIVPVYSFMANSSTDAKNARVFEIGPTSLEVENPFDINYFYNGSVELNGVAGLHDSVNVHDVVNSVNIMSPKNIMIPNDQYLEVKHFGNNGYIVKDSGIGINMAIVSRNYTGVYDQSIIDFSTVKVKFDDIRDVSASDITDIALINDPIFSEPVYFARLEDPENTNPSLFGVVAINNDRIGSFDTFPSTNDYVNFETKLVSKIRSSNLVEPVIRSFMVAKTSGGLYQLSSFDYSSYYDLTNVTNDYNTTVALSHNILDSDIKINNISRTDLNADIIMFDDLPSLVYVDDAMNFISGNQSASGDVSKFIQTKIIGMKIYSDDSSSFSSSEFELAVLTDIPENWEAEQVCVSYDVLFGEHFPVFMLGNDGKIYWQVCSLDTTVAPLSLFDYQITDSPDYTEGDIEKLYLTKRDNGYVLSIHIKTTTLSSIKEIFFTNDLVNKYSGNNLNNLYITGKEMSPLSKAFSFNTFAHLGTISENNVNFIHSDEDGVYAMSFDIIKPIDKFNKISVALQTQPDKFYRMVIFTTTALRTQNFYLASDIVTVNASKFVDFPFADNITTNLQVGNYVIAIYQTNEDGMIDTSAKFRIGKVDNSPNKTISLNGNILFRGEVDVDVVTNSTGDINISTSKIAPFHSYGYDTSSIAAISIGGVYDLGIYTEE